MFIFVEERIGVREAYMPAFAREGVTLSGLRGDDFMPWIEAAGRAELAAVEGIMLGESADRAGCARATRLRTAAPIIALADVGSLEQTLDLFAAGVDDVVRKPVHVRELLARCRAIRRRHGGGASSSSSATCGAIRVHLDGRDPEVGGMPMILPRRERRILEYLVAHQGRRVSKAQIFNAIYGLFDDNVEETVVESHVSKLRKKLRARLGYDPVESKRFLGYCLLATAADAPAECFPIQHLAPVTTRFVGLDRAIA
jgi:DNA-binding response OmpR family regulator